MNDNNVKSLFESHGLDTVGLQCASMILGTIITQRFTSTEALRSVDQGYFKLLAPIIADAAYSLAIVWNQSTQSQGQGNVDRPRFAVNQ